MINYTNKNLTKNTIKSYEQTMKLFLKFLEEYSVLELERVEEKHIRDYLNFSRERGKYSFVASIDTTKFGTY